MKLFYYFMAALCFVFAFFSLYDYVIFKRTKKTEGLILQLPGFLKKRINVVIGSSLRARSYSRAIELCAISFAVGFVVSLLEAFCTGQIYGPIIGIIVKNSQLRLQALFYLIIYNMMFVMPLVVIFVIALFGVSSQQLNQFLKKHIGKIKLALALLFLFLGLVILKEEGIFAVIARLLRR